MVGIDEFRNNYIDKAIVIFGAGSLTKMIMDEIGVPVEMVVDNDSRKWGMQITDLLGRSIICKASYVQTPDDIIETFRVDKVIVVIASYHVNEIVSQLRKMGIQYIVDGRQLIEKKATYNDQNLQCSKVQNNKVCIMMGNYGGHGYYITRKLLQQTQDVDIVWILRSPKKNIPRGVRVVYDGDINAYKEEMATAKVWLYDVLVPEYLQKTEGQFYIQVKHWGSITLKKFYLDEPGYQLDLKRVQKLHHNTNMMDYIMVGSEFDKNSCKTGFGYNGKFLEVGSPRTDVLYEKNVKEKVRRYYGLDDDTKLVIYAPTYRDHDYSNIEKLKFSALVNIFEKKFGGHWKMILRYHPSEAMKGNGEKKDENVINGCLYENSQELVAASDVMITDYSSIMFESAYVGKPVFLYAPDKEYYIREERDLLIDYDTLPFPISKTNEELITQIEQFDEDSYKIGVKRFLQEYGVHEDGHASERAAAFIMELMEK